MSPTEQIPRHSDAHLELGIHMLVIALTSHIAHPVKEDVKEKVLSPPLAGNQGVVTYIQPCLLLRGVFDFAASVRRVVQRRCHPPLMIPT